MDEPVEKVNKIDAAARQLREAILLFFERRDPIAIHTLAAASHQILIDLASDSGLIGILKNNPLVRPEKEKEWIALVNKSQNFFKHAPRDSKSVLEFRPSITLFFILDAVQIYEQVTGHKTHEQLVFWTWFSVKYPDFLMDGPQKEAVAKALALGFDHNDFSTLLALARGEIQGV